MDSVPEGQFVCFFMPDEQIRVGEKNQDQSRGEFSVLYDYRETRPDRKEKTTPLAWRYMPASPLLKTQRQSIFN
jgi:hypothetical protein